MARKKKLTIDKYNYGSYVIMNQQQGQPTTPQANFGSSFGSGASTGAQIGGQIVPGMGHIVGGIIGGVAGLFGASSKEKRRRNEIKKLRQQSLIPFNEQYESNIDSVNENPYGTYQDGGDVGLNLLPINIEAGEVLVDPQSGKIKREFNGINPETGGKYLPHATGRKKDTPDNIVTAEEGSFVITKAKAKEYKDAIANNDKLAQNSIMHNIRNKRRQSMKFADGGFIEPLNTRAGINPTTTVNKGPSTLSNLNLSVDKSGTVNTTSPAASNFDWGNLVNALPAMTNLVQGLGSPNYMETSRSPVNPYRNQILANMPRDINYSPLFNRIYRDRNTAYGLIDETTNSSAVARANKLNVMANTQRGIQDTYFQGEEYNNRVRAQRGGIYSNLGAQELDQFGRDRQFNYGVGLLNRQMQEGRRQQVNYGLTQLGQLYQNNQLNTQLQNRDMDLIDLLPKIYPALEPYLDNYRRGGRNGNR